MHYVYYDKRLHVVRVECMKVIFQLQELLIYLYSMYAMECQIKVGTGRVFPKKLRFSLYTYQGRNWVISRGGGAGIFVIEGMRCYMALVKV